MRCTVLALQAGISNSFGDSSFRLNRITKLEKLISKSVSLVTLQRYKAIQFQNEFAGNDLQLLIP